MIYFLKTRETSPPSPTHPAKMARIERKKGTY